MSKQSQAGKRRRKQNTRGISDVVSYVTIFSIILVSLGVITLTGIPALEDARDAEQAETTETAVTVLADNLNSVYRESVPSRATEIDVSTGALFYGANTSIEIFSGGELLTRQVIRPLVVRIDDQRRVVYEAGATFRRGSGGVAVRSEPPFEISGDAVHLPVIRTQAADIKSVSGTTALVRGVATNREIVRELLTETPERLTIEVASVRFQAWNRYFESQPQTTCTTSAGVRTTSCTIQVPGDVQPIVTTHGIKLSIIT